MERFLDINRYVNIIAEIIFSWVQECLTCNIVIQFNVNINQNLETI